MSIFTPRHANRELENACSDLRTELHHKSYREELMKERIKQLEADLRDERRLRIQAEAHANIIKNNYRLTRTAPVVPSGDEDEGYACPVTGCWTDIDHPFSQRYCSNCGAEFDWNPEPEADYDSLRDKLVDRALGW